MLCYAMLCYAMPNHGRPAPPEHGSASMLRARPSASGASPRELSLRAHEPPLRPHPLRRLHNLARRQRPRLQLWQQGGAARALVAAPQRALRALGRRRRRRRRAWLLHALRTGDDELGGQHAVHGSPGRHAALPPEQRPRLLPAHLMLYSAGGPRARLSCRLYTYGGWEASRSGRAHTHAPESLAESSDECLVRLVPARLKRGLEDTFSSPWHLDIQPDRTLYERRPVTAQTRRSRHHDVMCHGDSRAVGAKQVQQRDWSRSRGLSLPMPPRARPAPGPTAGAGARQLPRRQGGAR